MTSDPTPGWYRRLSRSTIGVIAATTLVLPFYLQPFQVTQLSMAMTLTAAVLGLGLLVGFTGQISLGHGAFFGLGAYTTAVLSHTHGWPHISTIAVGGTMCIAIGLIVGVPALRLSGPYLALLTLGLAALFPIVVRRYESVTSGNRGIRFDGFEAPSWIGLADDQWAFYLTLVTVAALFLGARNLVRSHLGRAMISVRDNPLAAQAAGVDVARVKIATFGLSAGYAGVAGGLNAVLVGAVSPESFPVTKSIELLAGLVIGGLGSVLGPVIGGLTVLYLPRLAADFNVNLAGVSYGVGLIVLMCVSPGGLTGAGRAARDRFLPWVNRRRRGGLPARELPSPRADHRPAAPARTANPPRSHPRQAAAAAGEPLFVNRRTETPEGETS